MTWTVDQQGTTAALTIGTETQFGVNSTTNATYVLKVNLTNMALGDSTELRIYTQDIAGGAVTLAWKASFSNQMITPVAMSPPVPSDIALQCTIKQIVGTGRTFNWEILRQ